MRCEICDRKGISICGMIWDVRCEMWDRKGISTCGGKWDMRCGMWDSKSSIDRLVWLNRYAI